jgi:hypothetical protein
MDASLDKLKCVLDQWSRATNAMFAVECMILHADNITVYDMMQLQEMASKCGPWPADWKEAVNACYIMYGQLHNIAIKHGVYFPKPKIDILISFDPANPTCWCIRDNPMTEADKYELALELQRAADNFRNDYFCRREALNQQFFVINNLLRVVCWLYEPDE